MLERQVADLVDDDQPVAAQPGQFLREPAGRWASVSRVTQSVAVANRTRWPCRAAAIAERGREMGFAGAGRAEQHDVAGLGEERAGGQGGDLLADGGLGVEVEVLEGLAGGEPGGPDPQLGAGGVAGGDFPLEHGGEVVLVGPAGVAGLVGQPGGGFGDPRCLQRGGQVADLLDRVVAAGPGCSSRDLARRR